MCIPLSNIIFKQQKTHMESLSMWAFFVLPPNWFQVGFLYNIFLYRSLRNPPRSADPHGLYLSRLQKLIGGIHTTSQHIGNFFRGYQGIVIIKHNGQSSFDGLLYCCRMSNHTRYRERATTCVVALNWCHNTIMQPSFLHYQKNFAWNIPIFLVLGNI